MKRALSILALSTLAACGGGGSGGFDATLTIDVKGIPQTPPPSPPPGPVVVCKVDLYGDSILAGAYRDASGATVYLAERPAAILKRMRPSYTVFDHTVPGETAVTRSLTFNNEQRSGRFVVFEHGVNDAAGGTAYEPALRGMVDYAKAEGRIPIITGLSVQSVVVPNVEAYNAIALKVATETVSAFANWRTVPFDPADMADDIHPGPRYAERLMARIVERLDVVAPECRS